MTRDLPLEFFTFLEREAICNLQTLELNRCQLTADHGAALTSGLLDNYKLKTLLIGGNRLALSDGGLPQGWVDLLEATSTLETLDISRNGLGRRGMAFLMTALARNRSLKKVVLDGNRMSDEEQGGTQGEVVYMFSTNRSIQELHLAEMSFDDDVLLSIAEGLAENRALKKLVAPRNNITTRGVLDATKHIAVNTTLEELELTCTRVQQNEEEYMRAYKFIIDNTNLETILM